MSMLGTLFELVLVICSLWIVINVGHALFTSKEEDLSKGFFWLSNKIKKDIK